MDGFVFIQQSLCGSVMLRPHFLAWKTGAKRPVRFFFNGAEIQELLINCDSEDFNIDHVVSS